MSTAPFSAGQQRNQAHLVGRFAHQLSVLAGTPVSARRITGIGVDWQIAWSDGPTVAALRARAEDLGSAVVGVDLARLAWARRIRPTSVGILAGLEEGHPGADVIELRPHRPAPRHPDVEVS